MYRIPARRHPYQDRCDKFASRPTPGGVAIQSPPRRSPQSPKFVSLCGFCDSLGHTIDNFPYTSPQLHNCSDAHLYKIATIQAQIDTLKQAKILARERSHPGSIQSPISPRPKSPYRFAPTPPPVSDTMEYSRPRGPMQPIYPGNPDDPDGRDDIAIKDYEPEILRLDFSRYELPEDLEEFDEPYQRPRGPTQPIGMESPDGTIIYFDYPDHPESPDSPDDIATEDYKPEIAPLNFSRYELPEEFEESYQRPRGPMQPILIGPDAESRISSDVSDQQATPPEIFAQFRDNEETATTTAPVELDEFFKDFTDDIFEYELESTQSSHVTSSSPAETRSATWYRIEPEAQYTPPSPLSLLSSSPACHLDTSLPLSSGISLDAPPLPAPDSPISLSLPSPSLPQLSGQRFSPMSQTQSFLRSFVTAASLCSKIPKTPLRTRLRPPEFPVLERSNNNLDLGIDIEDLMVTEDYSDHTAVQSELIPTKVPNASGDQLQVNNNETANLPSECDMLTEAANPAENSSILAEMLADYEELDDAPVVPRPSRSPSLSSIAPDITTLGLGLVNNSIALSSPHTTVVAHSGESCPNEQPSLWEYEPLPPSLPSPKYLTPTNLWDPSPLLSTVEHSPLVATFSSYASPAWSPTPFASPASASSPDIEPLDRYPEAETAPELSCEIPTGVTTINRGGTSQTSRSASDPFEVDKQLRDENSDESGPRKGTTAPSTSLTKYGALAYESPTSRSPVLAARRDKCSTTSTAAPEVPPKTSTVTFPVLLSSPDLSSGITSPLVLAICYDRGSTTLTVAPEVSLRICTSLTPRYRLSPLLDDGTPASLPSTLPPLSRLGQLDPPAAIVGPYQLPRARDWSGLVEASTSSPVLNPRPSPCPTVVLAQRVAPSEPLSTRSYESPRSRQSPVFVFPTFFICFFVLFAKGLFCFTVSRLLKPQAIFVVMFSISLSFLIFRLIFATLPNSLTSRAMFVVIFSSSNTLFVSQVFSYQVLLYLLGPREHLTPSRCSHFAFLNSSGCFHRLSCSSSCPLRLASLTTDSRYPKSRGGTTGHHVPFPGSPAPTTCYNQSLTGRRRQNPSPSPALSGFHAVGQLSTDAAFQVPLASRSFALFDKTPALLLSTLSPLSRPCRRVSGAVKTLSLSAATHRFQSDPESPLPESRVVVVRTRPPPQNRDQLGPAGPPSTRPLCRNNTNVLNILDVEPLLTFATAPTRIMGHFRSGVPYFHCFSCFPIISLWDPHVFSRASNVFLVGLVSHSSQVSQKKNFRLLYPSSVSVLFSFCPLSSFYLAFPFGLVFSVDPVLFQSRFFDRGRSMFEVPRRGDQPPHSTSQVPDPTTHLSSSSPKAAGPTPHIAPRSLAIDSGFALALAQPRLDERFCHGYIVPEFSSRPLKTSGQISDEAALFQESRDHTSQDEPQCPDHASHLPRSPGRIRIFRRSGYDGSPRSLEVSGSHRDIISDNRLLARASGPRSRDDGGAGSEGFLTSCYNLEIAEHLACSTASSQNQEGTHQPGMVGI